MQLYQQLNDNSTTEKISGIIEAVNKGQKVLLFDRPSNEKLSQPKSILNKEDIIEDTHYNMLSNFNNKIIQSLFLRYYHCSISK